ncbi:MAG: MFS transporter [Candidatus Acidiferrum sp.]|jgi:acyl-[acyl-carrier-protein]-phospholipid O-acyltransferase/long-chain-fatty-acid--[acyl-carrier-protein] ligase
MTSDVQAAARRASPPKRPLKGFWALIAVQFQGAFSDNALKWLVSFLVLKSAFAKDDRDLWFVLVVPLLFSIPFLLFSIPGGYCADKFSKRSVTLGTKCLELTTMTLATFALATDRLGLCAACLFLVSSQAAIFGPTKYALLPELLPVEKLSWGNGIIELTTLLSAIFAALAAGFLADTFYGRQVWSGVIFLTLSATGLLGALGIDKLPPADPSRRFKWNFAGELFGEIKHMREDRILFTAVMANTFFWFLGSLLLLNIVLYATDVLHVDEIHSSYLLAGLSLGIGIGSFLAGLASGRKIEYGMILPGIAALAILAAVLSLPGLGFTAVLVLLAFLGGAGGFFVVPVNASIQHRPHPEEKGRTIAAANLLSFIGVALQPVAQYAMLHLGHPNPARIFLICSALSLAMAFVLFRMLPQLWPVALGWTRLRPSVTL